MPILRVAVPSPLYRIFDYLPPPDDSGVRRCRAGMRVRVPFGRGRKIGVVVEIRASTELPAAQLKAALALLDEEPLLPAQTLALARWAAGYYHHPLGEVLAAILPPPLREGRPARLAGERLWRVTVAGRGIDPAEAVRAAPRQAQLLRLLQAHPGGLLQEALAAQGGDWRGALRALGARGWAEALEQPCLPETGAGEGGPAPNLNREQRAAVDAVDARAGRFRAFLLDGVTGSGKTEVYLHVIERALAAGRQALVLVPEIGLTPQLVARFRARFAVPLAVLHSGLSDRERLCAWLAARAGRAPIVIGTRSAVFTPLPHLGVIVVDEEHDPSLKQQEGFRYSARDVAVMRARHGALPVVLGSATPSLESLHNARQGRYEWLHLPARAGAATRPAVLALDVRRRPLEEGLSQPLLAAIERHLGAKGQVLLFLNRRGYAPTLICHGCGWVAECRRCDARLTLHRSDGVLRCHHCTAQRPADTACPACGGRDLHPLGLGTERVERALQRHFPHVGIARVDRDSTRRRGALEAVLDGVHAGNHRILIGTQMLAKGHDFPNVTLACVLDADHGLFGADFRAGERMAQLLVQVAGRAGRAERHGEVLIQTRHPDHPLLTLLLTRGYEAYAAAALEERRRAELPPYSSLVLLRAEAAAREAPMAFLAEARAAAEALDPGGVLLLGPVPAPMERRAGRYRAQLLLQASERAALHRLLDAWLPHLGGLSGARRVRWSIDVDPLEML
jgi:primosomal protein N' (replication factor Y) (superfamily II helicase)